MRQFLGPAAFGMLLFGAAPAPACSIPVFRYALERWQPSPYEFLIYRRGPLSSEGKAAVKKIEEWSVQCNLEATEVDLDGPGNSGLKSYWEKHGGAGPLPCVLVRGPDATLKTPPLWKAPLDLDQLRPVVDSPVRQEIIRRLFAGHSAVYLLLESGAAADDDAVKLLESELPKLQKRLQLPAPSADGPQLRSEVPVMISLPYIKMNRQSVEERAFIAMLMGCEPKLDQVKGPIVFAVFGRGRALSALHGKDLQASELENVSRFLCGSCSCQAKDLNPGLDLLFRCRWERFLEIELGPQPREAPASDKR